MHKIILSVILIVTLKCQSQNSLVTTINLKIKGMGSQRIKVGDFFSIIDSTISNNDTAKLSFSYSKPAVYQITFANGGMFLFFIDSTIVSATGVYPPLKFNDFSVKGSYNAEKYASYVSEINILNDQKRKLQKSTDSTNKSKIEVVSQKIDSLILTSLKTSKTKELNGYFIGSAIVSENQILLKDCFEELKLRYSNIEDFISDYPGYSDLIKEYFMSDINNIDKNITFNSLNKGKVLLNPKGKKYLLIDFMADWCKPCLASLPSLTAINLKFQNKIKVVSLAFNSKKENLIRIIAQNKISWPLVYLEGKEFSQKTQKQFKINLFPTYILSDEFGNVILRKTSEAGLDDIEKYLDSH